MKHELLAPAGSPDICRAVIAAGADAVYLGGEKYGARAFAQNFSEMDILHALDFAHLHGRKIFLTVNTLLKNREMGQELYDYLKPYYTHGLDAIIVQDYGVFQFVRNYFPDLPVHASTQMSVSNVYGAKFLQQQGAARIVTARELSLCEIKEIYDETGIEIESFVHGALCYCYSGQCLMSSILGGRSGNRGRCAQPCRLSYQVMEENGKVLRKQEKYPLSPKDLCVLELIPKLCETGIYSFKIEGRMKSLEYAAGVTQIYRKYLDIYESTPDQFQVEKLDYDYLLALGNRNGFTKGYYEMRNGRTMITLTDSSHSSVQAKEVYHAEELEKIPVAGHAVIRTGQPMQLTLSVKKNDKDNRRRADSGGQYQAEQRKFLKSTEITVTGAEVFPAQNRPLTPEDVKNRLSKTGDTPFCFVDLEVDMGESCFVPVKQINEIRRNGLNRLEQVLLETHTRKSGEEQYSGPELYHLSGKKNLPVNVHRCLNVQVSTIQQLEEVLKYPYVDMVSLDLSAENDLFIENGKADVDLFTEVLESCRKKIADCGKQAAFCFPYIFRENSSVLYKNRAWMEVISGFDRVWARSYDSLGFILYQLNIEPSKAALDHNLYVYSNEAYASFEKSGLHYYTASLELNQKEFRHMPNETAEFCLYGYIPMMISAQCVYKNFSQCYKNHPDKKILYLNDRYFKKFFIKRNCKDCYNIIYNSQPLYLMHQADAIGNLHFGSYRISFVSEKPSLMQKILKDYKNAFLEGKAVKAPGEKDGFTTGHFRRGVD